MTCSSKTLIRRGADRSLGGSGPIMSTAGPPVPVHCAFPIQTTNIHLGSCQVNLEVFALTEIHHHVAQTASGSVHGVLSC